MFPNRLIVNGLCLECSDNLYIADLWFEKAECGGIRHERNGNKRERDLLSFDVTTDCIFYLYQR